MTEKLAPSDRSISGPFDSSEVELPAGFLDFGSIRVGGDPNIAISLEVSEETGKGVALTFDLEDSKLQVVAAASSKHEGIWADAITQLADSIRSSGGVVEEFNSPLGRGINASIPQSKTTNRLVRFIGVDGPRWFLRGTVTGAAVIDPIAYQAVEGLFRSLVIHRGESPMPPREPLELVVPAGIITPPRPGN